MIGMNINAYFNAAMQYPLERLRAVMEGHDNSIPQAAAMMALQLKKPMIDAMKGQQAQQQAQQPSVKDKLLADTAAPADTGIAQLPAQNMEGMEKMAGGGIVAFAGGGTPDEVDPIKEWARKIREAREAQATEPQMVRVPGRGFQTISGNPAPRVAPAGGPVYNVQGQAPAQKLSYAPTAPAASTNPFAGSDILDFSQLTPEGHKFLKDSDPQAYAASLEKYIQSGGNLSGATPPAAGGTPATTGLDAVAANFKPSTAAGYGATLADISSAAKKEGLDAINAQYEDVAKQAATTGLERLRQFDEQRKGMAPALQGYEKSLQKEASEEADRKHENLQMAMINAGLAMAGGQSHNALANITQGALFGTKQYSEGIKDLRKAAKEREKALAMIEEARRAETRGDFDKRDTILAGINDKQQAIKLAQISGTAKTLGESMQNAASIVTAQENQAGQDRRTLLEQEGANKRAELQLQAVGKTGAITPMELMKEYNKLTSDIMTRDATLKAYPDFASFMRSRMAGMVMEPPKGANVVKLPGT